MVNDLHASVALEEWFDCSNWGSVPTAAQAAALKTQCVGAIIGLQDGGPRVPFVADQQSRIFAAAGLRQEFYVDLPGRRHDLLVPGTTAWIDVEPGCFQDWASVRTEAALITSMGLQAGIYGNETSMAACGPTTEFSHLPLWYASPDLVAFMPFNGWQFMTCWQRTSTIQVAGFSVCLDRRLPVAPPPPPPPVATKTHQIDVYSDGSYRVVL